ncbi:uncharacterized protein RHIMIDRAFT_241601 [Rhizopus microsporus ATCC 52813]|uniref:Uncharacterized protein n=1 Tax=Rhizopus microsporus ATCC 52813 TaxID=1340429 RepID=A0A2G4SIL0_RHIZD|nr:uncharacterized protein RHIMIDRAFT_241601 [Rhizopus microsporus ATCC 52813]PHZ08589.1 hypothetical protein RHIMIDRAFT_241601 [Rhizopus microsporus ATCC 52813]
MKDVHGSSIDDKTFNSAHDHLALIRLPAIIRRVRSKYKVETDVEVNKAGVSEDPDLSPPSSLAEESDSSEAK